MENGTMESATVEQRQQIRQDLSWPISIWLPEANRFFNGKSVNVSKGGAFISVPVTTPVAEGNEIEINFPRSQTLAKEKGQYARIKNARVLRVERQQMLCGGYDIRCRRLVNLDAFQAGRRIEQHQYFQLGKILRCIRHLTSPTYYSIASL